MDVISSQFVPRDASFQMNALLSANLVKTTKFNTIANVVQLAMVPVLKEMRY